MTDNLTDSHLYVLLYIYARQPAFKDYPARPVATPHGDEHRKQRVPPQFRNAFNSRSMRKLIREGYLQSDIEPGTIHTRFWLTKKGFDVAEQHKEEFDRWIMEYAS